MTRDEAQDHINHAITCCSMANNRLTSLLNPASVLTMEEHDRAVHCRVELLAVMDKMLMLQNRMAEAR